MLALGESRNPGSRSPYVLEALKGALEVRRRQPLQVGDTLPLHFVVTLEPKASTHRSRPFTEKIIFFSPRFQQLTPDRPGRLHIACYLELEQRYSPRPGTRCPQVNARPVWRFGAGPDSALRTCGARPSGLVLQQRGARQSSGIDSVSVEVLVARNAERIPTGFAPPPGKDLSRSSPVVQRDQSFEPTLAVLAKCVYDQ